jgi:hypothetical protein
MYDVMCVFVKRQKKFVRRIVVYSNSTLLLLRSSSQLLLTFQRRCFVARETKVAPLRTVLQCTAVVSLKGRCLLLYLFVRTTHWKTHTNNQNSGVKPNTNKHKTES